MITSQSFPYSTAHLLSLFFLDFMVLYDPNFLLASLAFSNVVFLPHLPDFSIPKALLVFLFLFLFFMLDVSMTSPSCDTFSTKVLF